MHPSDTARQSHTSKLNHPIIKPALFVLCLLPLAQLIYQVSTDQAGANPQEFLIRSTGQWALRFLCLTLAVTPLRVLLAQPAFARLRRMLGLYVFFYAVLHLLCYAVFDKDLDLAAISKDLTQRPFIWVGFSAWVLLVPLAATSWHRAIRWLGAQRWQRLHRLVYLIAGLALLHFFWLRASKGRLSAVLVYAAIVGLLLLWRVKHARQTRAPRGMASPQTRP